MSIKNNLKINEKRIVKYFKFVLMQNYVTEEKKPELSVYKHFQLALLSCHPL